MEGSPLGNAFGDSSNRGKAKKSFILIALAASLGLGGTVLATNINVNSGGTVEFGQGVATTVPCDNSMQLTPASSYDGTNFVLDSVSLTDVDGTACANAQFIVSVFASSATSPGASVTNSPTATSTAETIIFTFPTPKVITSEVAKITVETK